MVTSLSFSLTHTKQEITDTGGHTALISLLICSFQSYCGLIVCQPNATFYVKGPDIMVYTLQTNNKKI